MPERYNTQPVAPQKKDPVDQALQARWMAGVIDAVNKENTGWDSLVQAARGGALVMVDDQFNRTPVLTGGIPRDMGKLQPIIQASAEGRLFLKHKDSGQLMQMQHQEPGAQYPMSLSTPLDRVPGEPLTKPEAPSMWTYIVAFFFRSSKSAKLVEKYEKDLTRYEREQNQITASKETADSTIIESDQVGAKLENLGTAEFITALENMETRYIELKTSMNNLHLSPKPVREIRGMMLDYLQGQAAQKFLNDMNNAENPEQFLNANREKFSNMMFNMKGYVAQVSAGEYKDAIEGLAQSGVPMGQKLAMSKKMKEFVQFGMDGFENYSEIHGTTAEKPEEVARIQEKKITNEADKDGPKIGMN